MWRVLVLSLVLLGQATAPLAPTPPTLTELEQLRVQNSQLERVIVLRAVSDWQAKAATLKADLEKAHQGWSWNPDTAQWTPSPPPSPK